MVDDVNDVFAQNELWEGDDGSFLTADDPFIISWPLARLSKTVPDSGSNFVNVVNGPVYELEASQAANAEVGRDVERLKELA